MRILIGLVLHKLSVEVDAGISPTGRLPVSTYRSGVMESQEPRRKLVSDDARTPALNPFDRIIAEGVNHDYQCFERENRVALL